MLGKAMDVLSAIWDESRSIVEQMTEVGDAAGRAARTGQSNDVQQALQQQSAASGESYVVVSGDTLSGIAGRLLGDPARWPEIAALNGIDDPRSLAVGRTLVLPAKEGGVAAAGGQSDAGGAAGGQSDGGGAAGGGPTPNGSDESASAGGGGGLFQWLLPDMDPLLGTTQAESTEQGGGAETGAEAESKGKKTPAEPTWVSVARGEMGVKEIVGPTHNPRVVEYHSATAGFSDDETPWCASFVNWVLAQSGQSGTGSALALSFKRYGTQIDAPAYGAIAVISWGGGKGHVGFVVGKQGSNVLLLGGNQSNEVNITPFAASNIVAYVVPSGYVVPPSAYALGADGDGPPIGGGGGLETTR